jgi:hypothetical protein
MAKSSNKQVELFNQQTLINEVKLAAMIHDQVAAVSHDILISGKFKNAEQVEQSINQWGLDALNGMLYAKSKEEHECYHKKFNQLIITIKKELDLEEPTEDPLFNYRFYHQSLKSIKGMEFGQDNKTQLEGLDAFSHHPHYEKWQKQLATLNAMKSQAEFNQCKQSLSESLAKQQVNQQMANRASLELVSRNLGTLSQYRNNYLEKKASKTKIFKDLAWIGVGMLFVGAAAGLAIGAPFLLIPGLIIGAMTFSYGLIDIVKEVGGIHHKLTSKELGERKLTPKEIKQLNKDIKDFDIEKLLVNKRTYSSAQKRDKLVLKALAFASSGAGFALGAVALAAAIPAIAFPPVGAIIVAAISCAVIVGALAIFAVKTYKAIKGVKALKASIDKKTAENNNDLTDLCQEKIAPSIKDSTALIFQKELQASKTPISTIKKELENEKSLKSEAVLEQDAEPKLSDKPIREDKETIDNIASDDNKKSIKDSESDDDKEGISDTESDDDKEGISDRDSDDDKEGISDRDSDDDKEGISDRDSDDDKEGIRDRESDDDESLGMGKN